MHAIYAAAQRDLEAERQAANRFCVMAAGTEDLGHLGYRVVDLEGQVVASEHTCPRSARQHADQLVADEADRLVGAAEMEAER